MKKLFALFVLLVGCGVASADDFTRYDHAVRVRVLHEESSAFTVVPPLAMPLPSYPAEMLRVGITGDAEIGFVVEKDGSVSGVRIISNTQTEFGAPAQEAVTRWKFRPVTDRKSGMATTAQMRCRIFFELHEE